MMQDTMLKFVNYKGERKMKNSNDIYVGASFVLENFLDGAIADYEDGNVDNKEMIISCIYALKKLGDATWMQYLKKLNNRE